MIKNVITSLIGFLGIITLTFFLMKAIPGDPFTSERGIPPEIQENLLSHYGLKENGTQQYFNYLKKIFTLDFGPSLKYIDRSINTIIYESFPISLSLGLAATFVSLVFGISLGLVFAYFHTKQTQIIFIVIATLLISIPSFLSASLLQFYFGIKWHFLPIGRWGTVPHYILPVIALSLSPIAIISRLVYVNIQSILNKDYIVTARSKGLSEFQILVRHCLKNALLPLISYLGQIFANILVGSFIIEKIFGIPGLGQWFVLSINARDYPMIMALTVFFSFILFVSMAICDMIHFFLDPRSAIDKEFYAQA